MAFDSTGFRQVIKRLDWSDWIVWFGMGGWAALQFLLKGNAALGLLAVLLLTSGSFKLAAHRWTWHVILAFWMILLALTAAGFFLHSRGALRIFLLVGAVWSIWSHWRDRDRFRMLSAPEPAGGDEDEAGPKYSLVLWLREPMYLDAAVLGRIAGRAYGVPFNEGEECPHFVVGQPPAPYILKIENALFFVHNFSRNYFDDPDAAVGSLRELRRAEAVRTHRAWISMDFMQPADGIGEDRIHVLIGRMLAELTSSGAEVLAIFHPATGRIAPWAPELVDKLGSDAPLTLFDTPGNVPVLEVDSDSPAMVAAVAEARRRWPEFVHAFHAASDRDSFSVKAPVTEGTHTEFIWIKVKAVADGRIHGLLANDPVSLGDLKLNDFVSVAEAEINDWICPDPADPRRPMGLFTVKAVQGT